MILCFELSMPKRGSWNGGWSGADTYYAVTRIVSPKEGERILGAGRSGYYTYDFGDGWIAGITVHEVTRKEANKIRRKSKGFCNYDWMVNSIISHGKILLLDKVTR